MRYGAVVSNPSITGIYDYMCSVGGTAMIGTSDYVIWVKYLNDDSVCSSCDSRINTTTDLSIGETMPRSALG